MQRLSIRVLLIALLLVTASSALLAQVRISVTFAPPALPVYEQPVCPGDGYIWTPGYWAWSDDDGDYYWVPGTWVEAPEVGYLWTPPYWGWEGEAFIFHEGYWGPHIGFYGGVDYGFGYFGDGFAGGRWDNGHFFYNREVTNVNVTVIHNVYNQTVVNRTVNRVSYNGGNGGINARPSREQEDASRERHLPAAAPQEQQIRAARGNPELRASANHGKPPVAATPRAGEMKGNDVKPAREAGGTYNPPPNRGGARPENNNRTENAKPSNAGNNNAGNNNEGRTGGNPVHPKDLPPMEHPSAPNTGNQKQDQKYQQQQEKLQQKQEQDRQKLQQKQDKEDQRVTQQKADDARKQQVEQRHAQQTQQMQQKHTQQQQTLQHRQQPAPRSEPKQEKPPKN